jgi:hypothetical protein
MNRSLQRAANIPAVKRMRDWFLPQQQYYPLHPPSLLLTRRTTIDSGGKSVRAEKEEEYLCYCGTIMDSPISWATPQKVAPGLDRNQD